MNRYLMYLSYIGTQYRGVQKQFSHGVPVYPDETIQGILEIALLSLKKKPLNQPTVYPASRTDAGVHALCTAAHVDLEFPEGHQVSTHTLTGALNKFLITRGHDIRILSAHVVPPTFSARYSVIKKKYIYRFAVIKPDVLPHIPLKQTILPIPILEKDRCYFVIKPDFDVQLAQDATDIFIGRKDFLAFMGRPKQRDSSLDTERHIEELTLTKGSSLLDTLESSYYNFWEVSCTGKSFLFRQVRRMVGALIAIGQRKTTRSRIEEMFFNPTEDTWDGAIKVVPSYGLYLANVYYAEKDLLCEVDSKEVLVTNFGL